ncbi:hypothetical protein C0J52_06600 [Blattella germanica]|nr:hypothetical protein C0J52_06600 [Blattella germanica]
MNYCKTKTSKKRNHSLFITFQQQKTRIVENCYNSRNILFEIFVADECLYEVYAMEKWHNLNCKLSKSNTNNKLSHEIQLHFNIQILLAYMEILTIGFCTM